MIHRILECGRNQMKISDGTFSPCDTNIAHLSKFAVNFNLIIVPNPNALLFQRIVFVA